MSDAKKCAECEEYVDMPVRGWLKVEQIDAARGLGLGRLVVGEFCGFDCLLARVTRIKAEDDLDGDRRRTHGADL